MLAQGAAEVGDRLGPIQIRDQHPARGRPERTNDRSGLRLGEVFPVDREAERKPEIVNAALLEQGGLGAVADAGDLDHGGFEQNAHEQRR